MDDILSEPFLLSSVSRWSVDVTVDKCARVSRIIYDTSDNTRSRPGLCNDIFLSNRLEISISRELNEYAAFDSRSFSNTRRFNIYLICYIYI